MICLLEVTQESHNYLHIQPLHPWTPAFIPKYKNVLELTKSAPICPSATSYHFHQEQQVVAHTGQQTRSGYLFTELTAISSDLSCLHMAGLQSFCSTAHTAPSSLPSDSWGAARVPPRSCFTDRLQQAVYSPQFIWFTRIKSCWVTLNKRQNCFCSVFTHNKMNEYSKQTVHNVPYY